MKGLGIGSLEKEVSGKGEGERSGESEVCEEERHNASDELEMVTDEAGNDGQPYTCPPPSPTHSHNYHSLADTT